MSKRSQPALFHVEHEAWAVSRETAERLDVFVDLLRRWTPTINLIGRGDVAHIASRHVADALRLASIIPPGVNRALDMGSGGGFPGLVLAIATNIEFTLVEADARKCAFLREAARLTEAPAIVIRARVESLVIEPFRLITARALASLETLLRYGAPLLTPDGMMILPKGAQAEREIEEAARRWKINVEKFINASQQDSVVLRISGITHA